MTRTRSPHPVWWFAASDGRPLLEKRHRKALRGVRQAVNRGEYTPQEALQLCRQMKVRPEASIWGWLARKAAEAAGRPFQAAPLLTPDAGSAKVSDRGTGHGTQLGTS